MLSIFNDYVSPTTETSIQSMGKFTEHPELEAKRKEARDRMAAFGRVPLIKGGKFSRQNTVLSQVTR